MAPNPSLWSRWPGYDGKIASGPRKGVQALKVTDGATTLVLAATEDHAGFVRYAFAPRVSMPSSP